MKKDTVEKFKGWLILITILVGCYYLLCFLAPLLVVLIRTLIVVFKLLFVGGIICFIYGGLNNK